MQKNIHRDATYENNIFSERYKRIFYLDLISKGLWGPL